MNNFVHRMLGHYFCDEVTDAGGQGGGGDQQPPAATNTPGSLLSTAAQGQTDYIPEKLRVVKEDGSVDVEASSRKVAEAYGQLEKRLGTGDVPPKSAEEYAPKIEAEGFDWETFKAEPDTQAFLKGAHAKGLTNAQVEYVLGEYLGRIPDLIGGAAALTEQECVAELKTVWKDDQAMRANVQASYRAAQTFASEGDGPGSFDRLMAKYGNDPDFLAFTANIGKEIREDSPINGGNPVNDADFAVKTGELRKQLEELPPHDPKRPEVQAQLDGMYNARYNKGGRLKS